MGKLWDSFITALLKPFVRYRDEKIKLIATIEMDKQAVHDRHVEELLNIQERIAQHNTRIVQESTTVLKEWLSGLTQLSGATIVAPPVNDDLRQWRMENKEQELPDDLEAFIRQELANL